MKIIGIVMFILPVIGWFIFMGKVEGFRRAARLFGLIMGGLLSITGWYLIAWHFIRN